MTAPAPLWTHMPKAAALLADCAANPPQTRTFRYRFGETQTRFVRSDPRVAKLRDLYKNAQPAIDTPEWSAWLDLDVQRAIAEAVAAAALRSVADYVERFAPELVERSGRRAAA